jgi:single-strand DNA-binding protein
MNKVMLSGYVTGDIQLHEGTTPRLTWSIAINEYFGGETNTQFVPCVMFGKGIDFVQKYFKKGSGMEVEGRLNIYKNDEGKIYTSIMVKSVEFGKGSKSSGEQTATGKKEITKEDNPFDDSEIADLF